MKTIAVLIYDLTVEYHITVVDGILSYFDNKKDVCMLIAPVNVPHATTNKYDYQYWTIVDVLKNKDVDSVIVVANSFTQYVELEKITNGLKCLLPKPIISIATPLKLETNSYTYSNPDNAYNQIVEHLKTKHNRSKFAFFSGELNRSPDSDNRLRAFKKALKIHGLKYDKKLVFPGDFTPACTHGYIKDHYNSKEDVPFDALLCANDYMAAGAIGCFNDLGIKVPENVCVVGFDDAAIATSIVPAITTINQHIFESGAKAGELAYKAAYGEKIPKMVSVDSVPVYRQSCGCLYKPVQMDESYEQTTTYHDVPHFRRDNFNLFGNALNDMSTIYHMLNMSDSVVDFDDYFDTLVQNLHIAYIQYFAACFYSKPKKVNPSDDFEVPKTAKLMLLYDVMNDVKENYFDIDGIKFNTEEGLLPHGIKGPTEGDYYILPISLQNINYGYLICKIPMNKYTVYEVYLKIFINSMIHAYERTVNSEQAIQLINAKQKTEKIARTDELTKVLNRRGFFSVAQKQLAASKLNNNKGCVFFCDMDGLKKINDTYGHNTGDIAIKVMAQAISKACRSSDIVGRLSGDEFALLAPGFEVSKVPELRSKIDKLCETLSKKEKLPVVVSMSMGCAEFSTDKNDINKLLSEADNNLYNEKRIKHSQQ